MLIMTLKISVTALFVFPIYLFTLSQMLESLSDYDSLGFGIVGLSGFWNFGIIELRDCVRFGILASGLWVIGILDFGISR